MSVSKEAQGSSSPGGGVGGISPLGGVSISTTTELPGGGYTNWRTITPKKF